MDVWFTSIFIYCKRTGSGMFLEVTMRFLSNWIAPGSWERSLWRKTPRGWRVINNIVLTNIKRVDERADPEATLAGVYFCQPDIQCENILSLSISVLIHVVWPTVHRQLQICFLSVAKTRDTEKMNTPGCTYRFIQVFRKVSYATAINYLSGSCWLFPPIVRS